METVIFKKLGKLWLHVMSCKSDTECWSLMTFRVSMDDFGIMVEPLRHIPYS